MIPLIFAWFFISLAVLIVLLLFFVGACDCDWTTFCVVLLFFGLVIGVSWAGSYLADYYKKPAAPQAERPQ